MVSIDPEGYETRALEALVDLSDSTVLEIGAGYGRLTWRLAALAKSVVAFDASERDIRSARAALTHELRRRVRLFVADATTYRYPRNRFDVTVLSHSL
ncbi:MAG: class I SAM-dependent methyltransferase [Actinomycetota bacterium]|nr:class I SAM-dependent methyltransferase [Actinomycetota bacterium]